MLYDDKEVGCLVTARNNANISVPVTVKPRVITKDSITFCQGEPIIKKRNCNCDECRKGGCSFVLSQNVCIEIPIELSAETILGNASIKCEAEPLYEC